jgi:hypothetical protein
MNVGCQTTAAFHAAHMITDSSTTLEQVVVSPVSSCPSLEVLDLSGCTNLQYVLVQSASLQWLDLRQCGALTKVLRNSHASGCRELGGRGDAFCNTA